MAQHLIFLILLILTLIASSLSSQIFYSLYTGVMRINADGTGTAQQVTSGADVTGVAVDGDWVYFAESLERSVWRVNVDGSNKTLLATIPTTGTLEQIVVEQHDFGKHKIIYVIDTMCNLFSLHLNGSHFQKEIKVNTTSPNYICLGIDAYQGYVYVASAPNFGGGGNVARVDMMTGEQSIIYTSPSVSPNGIAVYNSSLVFFADWTGGAIYSMDTMGNKAAYFVSASPPRGPTQLAIGLQTLYWGSNGGNIGSVSVNGGDAKMFSVGFCWGVAWCFACGPTAPTAAPTFPGPTTAPTTPSSYGERLYFSWIDVYTMDLKTKTVSKLADASSAAGMAVWKGNLYYADGVARTISYVPLTGGSPQVLYRFNGSSTPQGLYIHEDDFGVPYLYVVDYYGSSLWRATIDGSLIQPVANLTIKNPLQLTYNRDNFYITTVSNNAILRVSSFTGHQESIPAAGGPDGIAAHNGEIYYTGFSDNHVYKMGEDGTNRTSIHALTSGYGIAVASDKIYVGSSSVIVSMDFEGGSYQVVANQAGWGITYCSACPAPSSSLSSEHDIANSEYVQISKIGAPPTMLRSAGRA